MNADGLDRETFELMGAILTERGVKMSGFWATRHELIAAWNSAARSTLLGRPQAHHEAYALV